MAEDFPETRIVEMVFPNHTNSNNQLFGGYALSLMDKLAFIVASRYARMPVVTASSDKIEFRSPAGAQLRRYRPLRRIPADYQLEHWLRQDNPDADIHEHTCVPLWAGERMDWNIAVERLFG